MEDIFRSYYLYILGHCIDVVIDDVYVDLGQSFHAVCHYSECRLVLFHLSEIYEFRMTRNNFPSSELLSCSYTECAISLHG